jgi:predicted membrane-bound spermidine synthase/Flp pilus assembly protein TadD
VTVLVFLFFFCSGVSGLIYQVVWVRVFGTVFGNTIYSASVVVAVFMFGLGVGSWLIGLWSDRQYATDPRSLLRAYGYVELVIAGMGLGISFLLPNLSAVSALVSSYSQDAAGWYVLSTTSYIARVGIALILLLPITVLMGGTLTLLVRHQVRSDPRADSWKIAVLYGVNTAGAALGCLLTDFALVPLVGLLNTQMVAASFNLVAGLGALLTARAFGGAIEPRRVPGARVPGNKSRIPNPQSRVSSRQSTESRIPTPESPSPIALTGVALALIGFAAMGLEMVWFRHLTILLGGFRAVFSVLLTVILIGIGIGSLICGLIERRIGAPAQWLMGVQAAFVATTLAGLALVDIDWIDRAMKAAAETGGAPQPGLASTLAELWFNARPVVLEVAVPALLMGFSFPLANAIVQRTEQFVGRRAGLLYLANTFGAVGGSLAAGFVFLPIVGIQGSATLLTIVAVVAIVPLYLATGTNLPSPRKAMVGSLLAAGGALAMWFLVPSGRIIERALPARAPEERLVTLREGLTEVISVTEIPGTGRTLITNGHPMSSTRRLSQRYMRALAHVPLISMEQPETVLVIGFGVGNTTHAATLHRSVRRVEVADLSKDILEHASYFGDANHDVLRDGRVVIYVNDGRHHLHMRPPGSYDLITLEPPPIAYAGVAALYSREFYELARSRLRSKGYISQWLPAYQVPTATTLAMIRAFVDVFPQSVLISGAESDLLLVGVNDPRIAIDPVRAASVLSSEPAVAGDLRRLDLGSVREIVGMFVGSAEKLAEATREVAPVTDDRPVQEYSVFSLLNPGHSVPASVVDLAGVSSWCPDCFTDGQPVALVDGLDTYLALLDRAYSASPAEVTEARQLAQREGRVILGSSYLGAVVPESGDVHDVLGEALATRGAFDEAIVEFRTALRLDPNQARAEWHLGSALASRGKRAEAIGHLRRAVELDPGNGQAHYDFAIVLLQERQFDEAISHLRATLQLIPGFVGAHNNLGIALASLGRLDEAMAEFQRALILEPDSAETRHNLAIARRRLGGAGSP